MENDHSGDSPTHPNWKIPTIFVEAIPNAVKWSYWIFVHLMFLICRRNFTTKFIYYVIGQNTMAYYNSILYLLHSISTHSTVFKMIIFLYVHLLQFMWEITWMFFILCKVCHSDKTCMNSNIFSQELQQSLCLQLFPQGLSEWLRFDYLATLSLVPSLGMPYVIALPPG